MIASEEVAAGNAISKSPLVEVFVPPKSNTKTASLLALLL
jgi:hypothetical protein